jgi:hypothetical protein
MPVWSPADSETKLKKSLFKTILLLSIAIRVPVQIYEITADLDSCCTDLVLSAQ